MTDRLPTIGIVTPSFNQAAYIKRTIDSVLDQGYPQLDYFVVDGGSTDDTIDILKSYGSRLHWISEPDQGQSDAINKGLRSLRGDILTYLNSDDVLLPGSLRIIGKYFAEHPNLEWVTGYCRNIDANDITVQSAITDYKNFWLRHYSFSSLIMINYISQMSTFWRRSAMEAIGLFDVQHHLVMDYDYWLRLASRSRPGILYQELSAFRQQPASKSSTRLVRHFRESAQLAASRTSNPFLKLLTYAHHYAVIVAYRVFRLR